VTPANIAGGAAGKVAPTTSRTATAAAVQEKSSARRLFLRFEGDGKTGRLRRRRTLLRPSLPERHARRALRLQFPVYRIRILDRRAAGDEPVGLRSTSRRSLNGLIASGRPAPRIYLLNNHTNPLLEPVELGLRQSFGQVNGRFPTTASAATMASRGCRRAASAARLVPGFGNVIISDPQGKEYWYNAIFLSLDRPYNGRWGAHVAWTHARRRRPATTSSASTIRAPRLPEHEVPGTSATASSPTPPSGGCPGTCASAPASRSAPRSDQRPRLLAGLRFGGPRAHAAVQEFDPAADHLGFRRPLDRLPPEKDFASPGTFRSAWWRDLQRLQLGELRLLNNFIPPEGNPTFGQPTCVVNLGRREQVGSRSTSDGLVHLQ